MKEQLFLSNVSLFLKNGYTFEESIDLCRDFISDKKYKLIKEKIDNGIDGYSIIGSIIDNKDFRIYFDFLSSKNSMSDSIDKTLNIIKIINNYKKLIFTKISYPLFLILFLFIFSLFINFFLLPKVNMLFISFQIKRTLFLNIVYYLFSIIPMFVVLNLSILTFLTIMIIYSIKNKKTYIINKFMSVNVLCSILKFYFSFKFALYYNEFIKEDLDNREIILFLCNELNDYDMKFIFYEVLLNMEKGEDIYNAVLESKYLENFFIEIIKIQNCNNSDILELYINICIDKINYFLNKFIKITIPVIYIFVGCFVIGIYIAIIIPMMNIMSEI